WGPPWKSAFEPGLVRFAQRFHALGVQGVSATIWTYDIDGGSCVYLSDHTADATRTSNESIENVLATANKVLVDGRETTFTATTAAAILYSLVRGTDFLATPPFYQNLAVGAAIDDHAYEFQLRIPKEVATEENTTDVEGVPTATLVLAPVWLTTDGLSVTKAA